MTLAEYIKGNRKDRRMTQADLARRTGFSREYIAGVESGRITPSVERARMMGSALNDVEGLLEVYVGSGKAPELATDPRTLEVATLFESLPEDRKDHWLRIARLMWEGDIR